MWTLPVLKPEYSGRSQSMLLLMMLWSSAAIILTMWNGNIPVVFTTESQLGFALLTLSWDKNWDSHSLVNGYPSFYPRIALVAGSPGLLTLNILPCNVDIETHMLRMIANLIIWHAKSVCYICAWPGFMYEFSISLAGWNQTQMRPEFYT